jgi:type IV pilus assembly protein PilB
VPQDGRFRVRYNGRFIDFRVSIMPSIHGEDAVLRVLDKESMSEKFHKLTLDVVGFSEDDIKKFRQYIASPTAWCWSPDRPARARRRRCTPR